MRPDDGCLVQPKHVAVLNAIINSCVLKECTHIVEYYTDRTEMTHLNITTSQFKFYFVRNLSVLVTRR